MTKKILTFLALLAGLAAVPAQSLAVTGSAYPSVVLVNQHGEKSINAVVGGSNQTDCKFTVAATDSAGLGITGLVGPACASVYMHTSATAAAANPNPAAGYILVQLASNFYQYVNFVHGLISPNSGNGINVTTGVVAGNPYIITALGTTTLAGWLNLGLPAGLTPTVNQSFIAPSTTVSTGTGKIQAPATSGAGVFQMEAIGDPGVMVSATGGASILLRTLAASSSSVTTLVATAPADGSVISLRFSMRPLSSQLH